MTHIPDDLPAEVIAQLSKDLRGDPILAVMKLRGGVATIDQILIDLYRQFKIIGKRNIIGARIYRLRKAGLCENVEGMKGVYRLPEDGTTCNLPFEHVPHCACDTGQGPQWTHSEYVTRTAACKLRGGPCRSADIKAAVG